jgi:RNase P subunit RPR2
MTVRVIKPSVRQVFCQHCASLLEYSPRDVQEVSYEDYLGDSDWVRYIVCPECEKHVRLIN